MALFNSLTLFKKGVNLFLGLTLFLVFLSCGAQNKTEKIVDLQNEKFSENRTGHFFVVLDFVATTFTNHNSECGWETTFIEPFTIIQYLGIDLTNSPAYREYKFLHGDGRVFYLDKYDVFWHIGYEDWRNERKDKKNIKQPKIIGSKKV